MQKVIDNLSFNLTFPSTLTILMKMYIPLKKTIFEIDEQISQKWTKHRCTVDKQGLSYYEYC